MLRAALRHRRDMASRSTAARQALKVDRKNVGAQIDRLLTAVAEGTIPDMSMVRDKLDDLKKRQEEIVLPITLLCSIRICQNCVWVFQPASPLTM